jgi:hypothetical protein
VLALHSLAQTPPVQPEPPPAEGTSAAESDDKPKFIWGMLLNMAVRYAVSVFSDYVRNKVGGELTPARFVALLRSSSQVQVVPMASFGPDFAALSSNGADASPQTKDLGAALQVKDGRENYQGVNLAIVPVDAQGQPMPVRPTSAGFRTGERFKLRLVASYDGLLSIDNINPQSLRRQVYPPQADHVVSVSAGQEILLPLDPQQHFRFAGSGGAEQLVVTLRHRLAIGGEASSRPVSRQDLDLGTNLVQEQPPGRYPLISQALALRHDGP